MTNFLSQFIFVSNIIMLVSDSAWKKVKETFNYGQCIVHLNSTKTEVNADTTIFQSGTLGKAPDG